MTGQEFLQQLQAEAEPSGFHRDLRAWVDDASGVARVLTEFDSRSPKPEEAP